MDLDKENTSLYLKLDQDFNFLNDSLNSFTNNQNNYRKYIADLYLDYNI